jgi:L-alanine-DL-glutamate epimerase-like enolase superfamily enzyme
MIVADADFQPCVMPLHDKDWRFALGAMATSRGWIVRIRSDGGHTGYGYANASPHMGSTFESLPQELERFRPLVLGKDPFAI